jgi:thiamine-monophosphate kinase
LHGYLEVLTQEGFFLRKTIPRKDQEKGTVSDLGERKIIDMIKRHLEVMPNMPVPFGDDVSAVELDKSRIAVLKTDMLVGKTDVPKGMSFWQAARKAIVMNVSDFGAKGVQPTAALVSLGIPADFMTKDIDEIARGLNAGARQYGLYVIGGDTGESGDLIISVSLFGTAPRRNLMLRNGAKPGDIVAVTGFFGKTAAGLHLLLDGDAASTNLTEILLSSICMPQARLQEGLALGKTRAVTSSIDSSDGLAWCLHEIARMSNVGFSINSLPVAEEVVRFAEFNNLDAKKLALYGGEEYELVLTVKPRNWVSAETACEAVGGQLLPIGKVTRDNQIILDINGRKEPIKPQGYEHFKALA